MGVGKRSCYRQDANHRPTCAVLMKRMQRVTLYDMKYDRFWPLEEVTCFI